MKNISTTKHAFIFIEALKDSNKWIANKWVVSDGNNEIQVINETSYSDYEKDNLLMVRLRIEQEYLIDEKKLIANYFIEEVLQSYKSVHDIQLMEKT